MLNFPLIHYLNSNPIFELKGQSQSKLGETCPVSMFTQGMIARPNNLK